MAPIVEQRRFAKEVAVAIQRQTQFLTMRIGGRDFDLALDDDVEFLARIAFLIQFLVRATAFLNQQSCNCCK